MGKKKKPFISYYREWSNKPKERLLDMKRLLERFAYYILVKTDTNIGFVAFLTGSTEVAISSFPSSERVSDEVS